MKLQNNLGISKAGAVRIVHKYQKTGELKNLDGRGTKKCTTTQEDNHIALISKRDRKKTASEIRQEFNETRENHEVSLTIIKDRLRKRVLNGRVAAKNPFFEKLIKKAIGLGKKI